VLLVENLFRHSVYGTVTLMAMKPWMVTIWQSIHPPIPGTIFGMQSSQTCCGRLLVQMKKTTAITMNAVIELLRIAQTLCAAFVVCPMERWNVGVTEMWSLHSTEEKLMNTPTHTVAPCFNL
jgi:hypothetical protein